MEGPEPPRSAMVLNWTVFWASHGERGDQGRCWRFGNPQMKERQGTLSTWSPSAGIVGTQTDMEHRRRSVLGESDGGNVTKECFKNVPRTG